MVVASYDFIIYRLGLVYASVCSSLPPEEVAARMKAEPTGIGSEWFWSRDQNFRTGQSNPCPCVVWPNTHVHYLFSC